MFRKFEFGALVNGVARKWLVSAGLFAGLAGICAPGVQAATAIGVATGSQHNCAVTSAGGAMCWGGNGAGQLGNGTITNSTQPAAVIGLTSGISAVAAGQTHSCALTTGGTVKCWGGNAQGQLGNGTATNSITPVDVAGLTGVIAISSGSMHTCALLAIGNVKCWGFNNTGQLGNGTTALTTPSPVSVIGVSSATAIASGGGHSCALLSNKTVQCWGSNTSGQLGNGSTLNSSTRVNVAGLSDVTSIAVGGSHTCANTTSGSPKCWGNNTYGQVGNGTVTNALLPTPVTGLSTGVAAIATSGTSLSTCAVLTSGDAKCWGANHYGQLGNGNNISQKTPVSVVGLSGSVSAIAISGSACALVSSGLQCFGGNQFGQLGVGTTAPIPFPVDVLGLAGSAPPSAPLPISPITSNTPIYTWKALPGATSYRLNVNGVITSYTAAAVGCDGGVGLCRVTGSYLTPGSYTWYVQGFNGFGDGAWSAGTTFLL